MTNQSEPQTPEEALLWLAGLEKLCPDCHGHGLNHNFTGHDIYGAPKCLTCDGSGKLPVLPELREPCSNCKFASQTKIIHVDGEEHILFHCDRCGGRGWRPRRGRDALHEAMHKDGWDIHTSYFSNTGNREVSYFKWSPLGKEFHGWAVDDHIAACRAMGDAGYGRMDESD